MEVKPFHALPGTDTRARVERLVQQIVDRRIDITQEEADWFRLACAFADEFGKEGGTTSMRSAGFSGVWPAGGG